MLFLSVIGGSLLLHAEEASALRLSLTAFLSIISKFPHVMKDETAELIISTTIQVYAVHNDNELICDSLSHLWGQLHIQQGHEYEFLLQVPSASLALLQEDSSTVPNAVLQQSPGSFVSALLMHKSQVLDTSKESLIAAVFKLLNALASDSPPPDVLGIEVGVCKYVLCATIIHSWKFSWDKIFMDGSKNENLQINFRGCWHTVQNDNSIMPNSWILFSQMLGQQQNL